VRSPLRTAGESWVEEPLTRFIEDARVRITLLLESSGRVLAQHGFTRSVDVMSACALAAAIHASAAEIGRQLDGRPFTSLHHPGTTRQIFLAELATPRGSHILLTVFDDATSIGLVRLYFAELTARLAAASPEAALAAATPSLTDFESDLNHNLAKLFGRI
jgi:predicted regulator of Ras-like GTPase activity (Roadblock/LC7/MglB family)